jgi:hypothetical protein
MAIAGVDIRRRDRGELCLGTRSGPALYRLGKLPPLSFVALFRRELGGWSYGAAHLPGGSDHTATTRLVRAPWCSWLCCHANHRVSPSSLGRMARAACAESMAVHGQDAAPAQARSRDRSYRSNAPSSAADIPNRGCFRSEKVGNDICV